MAQSGALADQPPSYQESAESEAVISATNTLQPAVLRLAERFVYSSESSTSPPLYELSHSIDYLRETHHAVTFERLDHSIKGKTTTTPQVTARKKLIYTLRHPPEITFPEFPYYAEASSRQAFGNLAIKKVRSLGRKKTLIVSRIKPSSKKDVDFEEAEKLFELRQLERKSTVYEWAWASSPQLQVLAVEDDEDGLYRLTIKVLADRMTIDALVAAWCLRLWQDVAVHNHQPGGWKNCAY